MGAISDAARLFVRYPRLWRFSLWLLFLATLLSAALLVLGFIPFITMASTTNAESRLVGIFVALLTLSATILFGGAIFMAIAGFMCSLGFERLSREVEELIGVTIDERRVSLGEGLADGFARLIFVLVLVTSAACIGLAIPFVPGVLAAGLVGLIDFTAPASIRRGLKFRRQWSLVFQLRGWPSFLLATGVVSLIPVVNFLCLPVLVAAGTILVARGVNRPVNLAPSEA